ncbi:sulfatase [bacterium]|nr:sulfatase [bacterium]
MQPLSLQRTLSLAVLLLLGAGPLSGLNAATTPEKKSGDQHETPTLPATEAGQQASSEAVSRVNEPNKGTQKTAKASDNIALRNTESTCQEPAAPTPKAPSSATEPRRNVLFIMVDDLRPQLGCFGKSSMHSPHIDELAKRGRLFERAYCMVPTCGASRASMMSGLRPHARRFVSYTARADEDAPGFTTMNQHFKNNGYRTISLGKIFHFPDDSSAGWSEKPWRPTTSNYRNKKAEKKAIAEHRKKYPKRLKVRGMPYEASDANESEYRDHQIATRAIEHLEELQDADSPFLLAVGFFKPHLPFCAPRKYWDLYDFESINVPENYRKPPEAPKGAVHQSSELRSYATIPPKGSLSTYQARKLIHGYYACVSFIDQQIGRLMEALEETGLADNTVIILCGDHGWQLGDHGMWNKHSCFETSMHTPLIVSVPGENQPNTQSGRITALTELIDIYPSVCELTGLTKPAHLQGTSFVPLLKNPTLAGKTHAVGRYRSGDTIRTDQFRLSEFRTANGSGNTIGSMLYDHRTDPDENQNIAESDQQQSTVEQLSEALRKTIPKSTD